MELSTAQPRSLNGHFLKLAFTVQVDGPESGAAVKPTTAPDNPAIKPTAADNWMRMRMTMTNDEVEVGLCWTKD